MIATMFLDFLEFLPQIFLYFALVAWTAAFAGMLLDLMRRLRAARA
jgi:hypothetical protein